MGPGTGPEKMVQLLREKRISICLIMVFENLAGAGYRVGAEGKNRGSNSLSSLELEYMQNQRKNITQKAILILRYKIIVLPEFQ